MRLEPRAEDLNAIRPNGVERLDACLHRCSGDKAAVALGWTKSSRCELASTDLSFQAGTVLGDLSGWLACS